MKRFLSWFWPETLGANTLSTLEFIVLIIINMIPVFGVLSLDWEVIPILLLYCIEAVVGIVFNIVKTTRAHSEHIPGFPPFFEYSAVIMMFLIGFIVPLLIIILVSDIEKSLNSLWNIYWGISAAIFLANVLLFRIKSLRTTNKRKEHSRKAIMSGIWMYQMFAILIIALIVTLTGTYKISLISWIVVKTYLEARSYLQRQTDAETRPVAYTTKSH